MVATDRGFVAEMDCHLALDLTDPTGRAHLAAWIDQQLANKPWPYDVKTAQAIFSAAHFRDMGPDEIDLLARAALSAMGREAC